MRKRAAIRIAFMRLGFLLGRLVGRPRRRVLLATAHTAEIGGNLAFIRDELASRRPPVPTVILAYRPDPSLRGLLPAAIKALRSGFHVATARISVVDDYFLPLYVAS
jgi:hypothetical protein